MKFGGMCGKIYACLEQTTGFVMQNCQILGARGGVHIFGQDPQNVDWIVA